MRSLRPPPPRTQQRQSTYVSDELTHSTRVFVHHDSYHRSLQSPYDSPFKVLERQNKYFLLGLNGRKATASIDRLKLAHIDSLSCSQFIYTKIDSTTPTMTSKQLLIAFTNTFCRRNSQGRRDCPRQTVTWAPTISPQLDVLHGPRCWRGSNCRNQLSQEKDKAGERCSSVGTKSSSNGIEHRTAPSPDQTRRVTTRYT